MSIKNIIGSPASRAHDIPISSADSSAVDAFGRWRVSNPVTIFESYLKYSVDTLRWEILTSGTGTITHVANSQSARLTTGGGNSGAYCYRQSRQYHHNEPGKSLVIVFTCVLGTAKNNVRQRAGYFDSNNGIFWEQTSTGLRLVQRTFTSGSAVDTNAIEQGQWNIDSMNGSGPSSININTGNAQIFFIDIQWLGAGRVRCGFEVDGVLYYCHEFKNANLLNTVYMSTGSLPIRFEIENTGTAAGGHNT